MSDDRTFIAYELYPPDSPATSPIELAPINRDWMDKAHQRHPYRCLPLVIANQAGWMLRNPTGFRAYWYGGPNKTDLEIQFDAPENRIVSHFGSGVITFTIPYLFRTPKGVNLWVKGPSNYIKDGVQPLEGVVETDWLSSTFTMNWKVTRVCEWVRFDKGEPFCMLVPIPRGLAESLVPRRVSIESSPEALAQYRAWEASRKGFLEGLEDRDPAVIKRGWQKDYFQGKTPEGNEFTAHQTRLDLKEFVTGEPAEGNPEEVTGKSQE
jgi:hypothetical protein